MNDTLKTHRVRWYDLVIAFFGGNLVGIVLTAIAGLVALAIAMRHGFQPTTASITAFAAKDFWANHVALVAGNIGLFYVAWLVARRRFERPFGHFFAPVSAMSVTLAALSGAALSVLANGGDVLLDRYHIVAFHVSDVERALVPHTAPQFVATMAVVAFFAPFVEEYFFRGLFFTWARDKWRAMAATLITAVVFAVAHGHFHVAFVRGHFPLHFDAQDAISTVELFIAGVVLALWVVRTGSLRTSFATHAAFNATAIVFSVLIP
jgi:membrane protease YdiL (CAAX protease family)